MPFTDEQKALMREMARVVIVEHIRSCPYPALFQLSLWKLLCLLTASGVIGGGLARILDAVSTVHRV